jgi:uncharacterized protein (TIGR03905 family)
MTQKFEGGCAGNLAGISKPVEGMKTGAAIAALKGTPFGNRPASCPDQRGIVLETALENSHNLSRARHSWIPGFSD